jgi:three-Cys-motif partner protein
MVRQQRQLFGGDWTAEKLEMLRRYLTAYTTALRNQPFRKLYIDAFAGPGYRDAGGGESPEGRLFPELREDEPRGFLDGSPRIALQIEPAFDEFVFIEKSQAKAAELMALRDEFIHLAARITVVPGDCNRQLLHICEETDWRRSRAVLFLDPFAMQLEWSVLQAVARTKAIDTWVLWPVMAMNRLLQHEGKIPAAWRQRLDQFLGTDDWYCAFYRVSRATDLFGQDIEKITKVANIQAMKDYVNRRLAAIFADVAGNPRLLVNSRRTPLFLLCFAAANPKGAPIAKRIAEHILREQ